MKRIFYVDPVFHLLLLGPIALWILLFLRNPYFSTLDTNYLILLVLIIPTIEEVIFRGLLQPWIAKRYSQNVMNITQANFITSSIFTLLHLIQNSMLMTLFVFIPSLAFGYTRERYNRITPSILLHSSYNGGYFLVGIQLVNN